MVAEAVGTKMTQTEAETEMREIVDFLRSIHRWLGTE